MAPDMDARVGGLSVAGLPWRLSGCLFGADSCGFAIAGMWLLVQGAECTLLHPELQTLINQTRVGPTFPSIPQNSVQ